MHKNPKMWNASVRDFEIPGPKAKVACGLETMRVDKSTM